MTSTKKRRLAAVVSTALLATTAATMLPSPAYAADGRVKANNGYGETAIYWSRRADVMLVTVQVKDLKCDGKTISSGISPRISHVETDAGKFFRYDYSVNSGCKTEVLKKFSYSVKQLGGSKGRSGAVCAVVSIGGVGPINRHVTEKCAFYD